jgi:hypothetical protein
MYVNIQKRRYHQVALSLLCVHIYLLSSDDKDICDSWNVSVKLLCVYVCLFIRRSLHSFVVKSFLFFPYFCVINTSVLSLSKWSQSLIGLKSTLTFLDVTCLCRNMWSDWVNLKPQHRIAICWSAEPMGNSNMRSAMVCSRVWNVDGRGWTASPAMLMSLSGCSHTPRRSWKPTIKHSINNDIWNYTNKREFMCVNTFQLNSGMPAAI